MTAVREAPVTPEPAAAPEPAGWLPPRRKPVSPVTLVRHSLGASLLILAVSALFFVAWLGLFSRLHYDKAQLNAYEALRVELANGTAPNGPVVQPTEQPTSPADSIFAPAGSSPASSKPAAPTILPWGSPLAVLSIPAIGLRTVILEGTSGAVLENGPGHLRDTPMPGQAGVSVIFGRKAGYGGPFSKLGSLQPGDSIAVVTGQAVSAYKVLDVRRAGDPLPQPPATGAGRMILVTADGSPLVPSGIMYVDADLISKVQPGPSTLLSAGYLSPVENAMSTDSAAWLPIMLWAALLMLVTTALSWLWIAWGRWQTWLIAVPIVGYIMLSAADEVTRLLPNLL